MKIALVYTGAGILSNISSIASDIFPQCEIMNILDDSLIKDCIKAGYMTNEVKLRLINIFQYAYYSGAGLVLLTCSSVGESAELGNALVPIPILRIDQPMCEEAVSSANAIGVIGTLPTTLLPTSELIKKIMTKEGKTIPVETKLAEGAYEAGIAGNFALHDKLIEEAASELTTSKKCDVIVLAQASMARMEKQLTDITNKKVLSSPVSGISQLKAFIK